MPTKSLRLDTAKDSVTNDFVVSAMRLFDDDYPHREACVCIERIDKAKVQALLRSRNPSLLDQDIKSLKQYLRQYSERKGGFVVTYKFSKNANGYGRLYACGTSLQNVRKEIRHTLAGDVYADIDIAGCSIALLKGLFDAYALKSSDLDQLFADKAAFFQTNGIQNKQSLYAMLYDHNRNRKPRHKRSDSHLNQSMPAAVCRIHRLIYNHRLFSFPRLNEYRKQNYVPHSHLVVTTRFLPRRVYF